MTAREHYRPEIQGLRAVAALLVAAYHIWLGRVSSGVDVFFVVTGFLTTRTLLGHLERSGRIDFATFWAGLARRLLPAARLVLAWSSSPAWSGCPRSTGRGRSRT